MTNKLKLSAAALFSAIALGGGAFTTATTVFAEGETSAATTESTDTADKTNNDTPATNDPNTGEDLTKEVEVTNNAKSDSEKNVTATGHAYVSFSASDDEGPWNPGDPDDKPDNPGNGTNDTGYLRLVAIPRILNFGDNKITGGDQTMTLLHGDSDDTRDAIAKDSPSATTDAQGNSQVENAYVIGTQVMNIDPLKPEWSLSAKLSDFTDGNSNKLEGATIAFTKGMQQNIIKDGDSNAWNQISGAEGALTDMTLTAGGDAQTYKTSKVTGPTQQIWRDSDVTLKVPGSQIIASSFTANIDWNLSANPITPAKTDAAAPAAATTTTTPDKTE
ncbi:WxL domain-containing protein [Lacticaseibacillus jixiensis]|uniref:WxL domain-containing protein n=1 Tax=Lacticaseibacillus jixiensis TaxID=3231926 RepID=UPI0036F2D75B